jgi:transposase InsO family protein
MQGNGFGEPKRGVLAALTDLDLRASMGRVGSCFDNAVAESWFATLKTEIGTTIWATREQHRGDVFAFIQRYNRNDCTRPWTTSPPRKQNCATVTSYRSRHENPVPVEAGELQFIRLVVGEIRQRPRRLAV